MTPDTNLARSKSHVLLCRIAVRLEVPGNLSQFQNGHCFCHKVAVSVHPEKYKSPLAQTPLAGGGGNLQRNLTLSLMQSLLRVALWRGGGGGLRRQVIGRRMRPTASTLCQERARAQAALGLTSLGSYSKSSFTSSLCCCVQKHLAIRTQPSL